MQTVMSWTSTFKTSIDKPGLLFWSLVILQSHCIKKGQNVWHEPSFCRLPQREHITIRCTGRSKCKWWEIIRQGTGEEEERKKRQAERGRQRGMKKKCKKELERTGSSTSDSAGIGGRAVAGLAGCTRAASTDPTDSMLRGLSGNGCMEDVTDGRDRCLLASAGGVATTGIQHEREISLSPAC